MLLLNVLDTAVCAGAQSMSRPGLMDPHTVCAHLSLRCRTAVMPREPLDHICVWWGESTMCNSSLLT